MCFIPTLSFVTGLGTNWIPFIVGRVGHVNGPSQFVCCCLTIGHHHQFHDSLLAGITTYSQF